MLLLTAAILGIVTAPINSNLSDAIINYVRPVLKDAGGAARVNYMGVCSGRDLYMPDVTVGPISQTTVGMAAVKQRFQSDPRIDITRDANVLLITVGAPSTDVLQTKLPFLVLDQFAQNTPKLAIYVIATAVDAYAKEHQIAFSLASTVLLSPAHGPGKGMPHLPSRMQNMAVDEMLNSVASTFNGIVLYGTCKLPDGNELFRIDYIDGP